MSSSATSAAAGKGPFILAPAAPGILASDTEASGALSWTLKGCSLIVFLLPICGGICGTQCPEVVFLSIQSPSASPFNFH